MRHSPRSSLPSPSSSRFAEIVVSAARDPGALSEADRIRFLAYQHHFFDTWEIGWYYHMDGILNDETWRGWDEWFTAEARRRPAFGWTDNRHNFTGLDFRAHVDGSELTIRRRAACFTPSAV
jgi:hypothetical protein